MSSQFSGDGVVDPIPEEAGDAGTLDHDPKTSREASIKDSKEVLDTMELNTKDSKTGVP